MATAITTAIVTILMFLVMVSLHEFGHFIVGRLLGFRILEYAIGFGPALLKSKKTETEYSLRAIPLGGFCRFDGEDTESDHPGAFYKQAVWKRMLVVMAGGISNVILGFILFLIIVPMSSPVATNTVRNVVEHSYVAQAGLMAGDVVVSVDGRSVGSFDDISLETADFEKDTEAEIEIKRNGEKKTIAFKPTENVIERSYTETGIIETQIINGHETTATAPYSEKIPYNAELVGKKQTHTSYIIGVEPEYEEITFQNVWAHALNQTRFSVRLVYKSLWWMLSGKVGVDQMSGPIGIVSEVNTAVSSGEYAYLNVLSLVALITINLGVFNLLPFPALDGGRLFFMLIELIRRKPIPPEREGMIHAIGMLLLLGLVVYVSFNDIMRLIE